MAICTPILKHILSHKFSGFGKGKILFNLHMDKNAEPEFHEGCPQQLAMQKTPYNQLKSKFYSWAVYFGPNHLVRTVEITQ